MLKAYYKITIKDAQGHIVKTIRERLSHSFVKAFMQMLEVATAHQYNGGSTSPTIPDTGNTNRALALGLQQYYAYFALLGPVAINTYGIVVGTGTNAESVTDYALQTIIAHGNGAGQLSYGVGAYVTSTVSGSDVLLVFNRTFTNGSGGDITINEIGMYCSAIDSGTVQRYFCVIRDKLAAGVTVSNGQTCTVQYTLKVTN